MEEKDLCCEVVHKDDVTRVQQVVPVSYTHLHGYPVEVEVAGEQPNALA